MIQKGYTLHFIVKSSVETAFSEAAHYRDYLIVLGKRKAPLIICLLKKPISEISQEEIAIKIKEFEASLMDEVRFDNFEMLKNTSPERLIKTYIQNLKPLISFTDVKRINLALELLSELEKHPKLSDLESKGIIKIRVYNPRPYKTRGVEDIARKLFASKYSLRSPNAIFLLTKTDSKYAHIRLKNSNVLYKISLPSLRSYSNVGHMNITDEEEVAITEVASLPTELMRLFEMLPRKNVEKAANDIKEAYNN